MTALSEQDVRAALTAITDPVSGEDIVSRGMVSGLVIRDRNVGFAIEVDPAEGERMEPLRRAAEDAVRALPGVSSVTAVLTAHNMAPSPQSAPQSAPQAEAQPAAPQRPTGPHGAGGDKAELLPQVKWIIAVASGKGGVGKSTTAANLALALAEMGQRVGLLDADIYGPSMPRMLGVTDKPQALPDKRLTPMHAHGISMMSIGLLIEEDTPMIWRGPMVMGALEQMMRDVDWGPLDIMVVDLPPGTGDAQLTMAQRVPLSGAVIVSTPQDIALIDARKGLNMFLKVNVPVLGIIENMSYFACPHCGERTNIFGHGGARDEAAKLKCDFLGEIPLDLAIRVSGDGGIPIVAAEPDGTHAAAFRAIAAAVLEKLAATPVSASA